MHFKFHGAGKIRMTYKAEGYGLHTDALSQKGYTYQIFMYTYTAPKEYLAKRLS